MQKAQQRQLLGLSNQPMMEHLMAEQILSQERLKQVLDYNQENGIFTRKIKTSNSVKVGEVAGTINTAGYRVICIDGKHHYGHRLAWLYVHNEHPPNEIDHINECKSDNRICNLRKATSGQNKQNITLKKNNKSGVRGVFWYASKNKWIAYLRLNGKRYSLGYHSNFQDAVNARKLAENKFFTHHKETP